MKNNKVPFVFTFDKNEHLDTLGLGKNGTQCRKPHHMTNVSGQLPFHYFKHLASGRGKVSFSQKTYSPPAGRKHLKKLQLDIASAREEIKRREHLLHRKKLLATVGSKRKIDSNSKIEDSKKVTDSDAGIQTGTKKEKKDLFFASAVTKEKDKATRLAELRLLALRKLALKKRSYANGANGGDVQARQQQPQPQLPSHSHLPLPSDAADPREGELELLEEDMPGGGEKGGLEIEVDLKKGAVQNEELEDGEIFEEDDVEADRCIADTSTTSSAIDLEKPEEGSSNTLLINGISRGISERVLQKALWRCCHQIDLDPRLVSVQMQWCKPKTNHAYVRFADEDTAERSVPVGLSFLLSDCSFFSVCAAPVVYLDLQF